MSALEIHDTRVHAGQCSRTDLTDQTDSIFPSPDILTFLLRLMFTEGIMQGTGESVHSTLHMMTLTLQAIKFLQIGLDDVLVLLSWLFIDLFFNLH